MDNLKESRMLFVRVMQEVLVKKQNRKKRYLERQEQLVKICRKCSGNINGPWYCEDCTTGRRLQNLDAEYSDINNWWQHN
ncbi:MAG: hypothetical protein J5507_02795 [Clostridia bacterium]|nr:hypothetical protein [Clostridia bacterium]